MKHLVVGAGATLAQALALGNRWEDCPPLISNFARKTWADYTPSPYLDFYIKELGFWKEVSDARELFYELETAGLTNIEKFMEFAWHNRHLKLEIGEKRPPDYIAGLRISVGDSAASQHEDGFWENLLYHGIGRPLADAMIVCFHRNGVGFLDLQLTKRVASPLKPGDLVLNLNYDTVFELALSQLSKPFKYAPNALRPDEILVCKPHGSLNMALNSQAFAFGQPEWLGMPQPAGFLSYSGLIPPRLNKAYEEHPIAKMILDPSRARRPQYLTMWGVGLAESDNDLISLYREWATGSAVVEIINPSEAVAQKARELFTCEVRHFESVDAWENRTTSP